jgi:predicted transcriptional regulator
MGTKKPTKKKTRARKKPKQKAADSATVEFSSLQSMEGVFAGMGLGGG